MKPSLNSISTEGVKLVSFSVDTCGFFARSVQDLQLLADTFAFKTEPTLPCVSLQTTRVALVKTAFWDLAGPDTVKAMSKAAKILREQGVAVKAVELPAELNDPENLKVTHSIVVQVEAQAAFLKEYRADRSKLHPMIRGAVENESNWTVRDMIEATNRYNTMRYKFDTFAADYDAIITPSAQDVAPLGLGNMGGAELNFIWTVSDSLIKPTSQC